MKTKLSAEQSEAGSTLVMVLGLMLVGAIMLAGYLNVTSRHYFSIARSQQWNTAIPVAEAGIEEGMAHLNKDIFTNGLNSPTTPQYTASGWTINNHTGYKTHATGNSCYMPDGVSYYDLVVSNIDTLTPEIHVKAYTPAPLSSADGQVMFAAVGLTTAKTVSRKIKVTTRVQSLFPNALAAKGAINLKGNNVHTDSFDSSDPDYSTGGEYDATKSKAKGDVATNSSLDDTLSVGNADIEGSVHTGPGGEPAIGANGSVGDKGWDQDGIQPGHFTDDMNQYFPDVEAPYTSGIAPTSGSISTTNITYSQTSSNYTYPTYPTAAEIGDGVVLTNTAQTTASTRPTSGFLGSITTNTAATNSATFPSAGTYVGLVTTNLGTITTATPPAPGTYVGSVVPVLVPVLTNTTVTVSTGTIAGTPVKNSTTPPSSSICYLNLKVTGSSGNQKYAWDPYNCVYTTNKTVIYTTNYTYEATSGFSYDKIVSYTYTRIVGYLVTKSVPTATNLVSTAYDFIITAPGDYYLDGNLSGKVLVNGSGTARLYVTGNVSISGQGGIKILDGVNFQLYVGGASTDIAGNGVMNENGTAESFKYFGLPTNTSINMHGNFSFTGQIYAPHAALSIGGGGNDTYDFVGAAVCASATLNGHANFHYDEALAKNGLGTGFMIGSWTEEY